MVTNEERLINLEQKIDSILEHISPKEAKTGPVSNETIIERIEELQTQVVNDNSNLLEFIRKSEFIRKCDESISNEEFESEADKKFNTRRNIFVLGGLVVTGALSLTFWLYFLPLFSVAIGVFFTFGMLALLLAKDEFVLPGNTIKRIAQNAIASAIFILAFVVIIGTGIQVGNSLISDRSSVEEYRPPTAVERQHTETKPEPSIGDSEE